MAPSARPSDAALRLLADLVAMDTTSRDPNLALIAYVEELLSAHSIVHERVPDADGTKAGLIAHIGPQRPGGVVLSGHTDCVPVDGQPWSRPPFALTEEYGRVYGRGTSDMKGFIATVLAAIPAMAAAPLTRPIQLALTFDEELGTIGAPAVVEALLARFPRPDVVLIGEPTLMEVVNAHKGVRAFRVTATGKDGHSSQPHLAANAITAITRIAARIADVAETHRQAAADPRFDPPYTTFNLAMVAGGQALNIVPRQAELTFEFRPVPADDTSAIADDLRRFAEEEVLPDLRRDTGVGDIGFEVLAVARALGAEPDGPAEALARTLSGYTGPSRTVPFGTDGGHFQAAGLSTVVLGPGSIEQAHQPDEWIALSELAAGERLLADLVAHLSR